MPDLHNLLTSRPLMTLEDFVDTTNDLLPNYLPGDPTNTRVKNEVNARLIRHYATEGLLEAPLKEGREARYEARHLLQILVIRKLLAEGLTATAIGSLACKKTDEELLQLLEGGVRVEISSQRPIGNEALAFLDEIRRRDAPSAAAAPQPAPAAKPSPAPTESRWDRYPLMAGLELHVRGDFTMPSSLKEQQNLIAYLTRKLIDIDQRR